MTEDRIRRLVYVSDAMRSFSDAELAELLAAARERNGALGITGMLLYKGGNFIQTIEGPSSAVDRLMRTIRADKRHGNVFVMLDEPDARREFARWSMGYRRVAPGDAAGPQLDELLLQSRDLAERISEHTLAQRFLRVFEECLR